MLDEDNEGDGTGRGRCDCKYGNLGNMITVYDYQDGCDTSSAFGSFVSFCAYMLSWWANSYFRLDPFVSS